MDWIVSVKAELQAVFLLFLVLAALKFGQAPERASAFTLVWMWVADRLFHLLIEPSQVWVTVATGHLLIDASAFVMFLVIALRANRVYPICLSAFQGIAFLMHFVHAINPANAPLAYSILSIAPSYLMMLTLIAGLLLHSRRTRRYGRTRSWRSSYRPS